MVTLPCPGCGKEDREPVWSVDRYFLRVNLSICRHCGLVHLARGFAREGGEHFYRRIYPRLMWSTGPGDGDALIAGYRFNQLRNAIGPFDRVFEVGAGFGYFLQACREGRCGQIFGIEPGELQYRHACEALGLQALLSHDGLFELGAPPFRPEVTAIFHVLEHLDDPGAALERIGSWMDEGAWLVVEVPDIEADWRSLGLRQVHVSHRSYFSEATLGRLLRRCGFVPAIVQRERAGVYPGNLRVFARRTADRETVDRESAPVSPLHLAGHIRRQIRPWSLRSGYPRAAIRLLRLSWRWQD